MLRLHVTRVRFGANVTIGDISLMWVIFAFARHPEGGNVISCLEQTRQEPHIVTFFESKEF